MFRGLRVEFIFASRGLGFCISGSGLRTYNLLLSGVRAWSFMVSGLIVNLGFRILCSQFFELSVEALIITNTILGIP